MIRFLYNGALVESPLNAHSIAELKTMFPAPIVDEAVEAACWCNVREKRDLLIQETDWTQMPDAPLSADKKMEFVEYRKSLRDIPQTFTNPDDVAWPVKPQF